MDMHSQTHPAPMAQLSEKHPTFKTGAFTTVEAHAAGRHPDRLMTLRQLGSFFPTRLSFLRVLLRELAPTASTACWTRWTVDSDGYGEGVLTVDLGSKPYSLIAYTAPLTPENRTDRVIAEAWDACFVLYDGVPSNAEVDAIRPCALVQEKGRFSDKILVLSRANKSVRLFEHVVTHLADGDQPDAKTVDQTGYLMRTTAVYGNGKFGIADRTPSQGEQAAKRPFRYEMLCVYLIREFTLALVEHIASARSGKARKLDPRISQSLGIGNSTGLGMAPFLVNHPALLHRWIVAREEALSRVTSQNTASASAQAMFEALLVKADIHLRAWTVPDPQEQKRINALRSAFETSRPALLKCFQDTKPWQAMLDFTQSVSSDLEEFIIPLMLEPHGDLIDDLANTMSHNEPALLNPRQTVESLTRTIEDQYGWTSSRAFETPPAMTWYVSEEKLEPRFGVDGPHFSPQHRLPLDIARAVRALTADLAHFDGTTSIATVLAAYPHHRLTVARVQLIADHPYGEIRDDLVSHRMRPIDMLRCKLSFFGADRFDPKSDRWTRVRLFGGAPRLQDLNEHTAAEGFLSSGSSTASMYEACSVNPQVPA